VTPAIRLASFDAAAPEESARAKALLNKVIAAKGGVAALSAIRTVKAVTSATMKSSGGNTDTQTTTYLEYPSRVRVEIKLPQGLQIQAYDRGQGWSRDAGGVRELPRQDLYEVASSLWRDQVALPLAAFRGGVRMRVLPDVRDESGKLSHALELSSADFTPLILYVDAATNLVYKQTYVLAAPGQPLVEELFSDFRVVDRVKVPFTAEVRRAGQRIMLRHISRIEFNVPIGAALFKRPAP
jgi:hypothetical protein